MFQVFCIKLDIHLSLNSDDVNDNSPEFSERSQTVTVDETSTVPVKYPLSGATDRDSKKNRLILDHKVKLKPVLFFFHP